MGTRISYHVLSAEPGAVPAAILYSNSKHPDVDAEALFAEAVAEHPFSQTDLVRHLLSITYPSTVSGNFAGHPVFTLDLSSGDREKILRAVYGADGFRIETLDPAHPGAPTLRIPDGWTLATVNYSTPSLKLGDGVQGSFLFAVRADTAFEPALRASVADWLSQEPWTEDYPPNWGDAVQLVPPDVWLRHGLQYLPLPAAAHTLQVDHDDSVLPVSTP